MNSKGFTLIELLAMMVVLGILMAVSAPNITGILNNQKDNALREDAVRMTDRVKTLVATTDGIEKPTSEGECLIFTLGYLDLSDSIKKGPNGGEYLQDNSFVILTLKDYEYKYYVRIVEDDTGHYNGIKLSSLEDINKNVSGLITKLEDSEVTGSSAINKNNIPSGIVNCTTKEVYEN